MSEARVEMPDEVETHFTYEAEDVALAQRICPQTAGNYLPPGNSSHHVEAYVAQLLQAEPFRSRLAHVDRIQVSGRIPRGPWWAAPGHRVEAAARLHPRLRIGKLFVQKSVPRWTVLHELAHLATWDRRRGRRSHGARFRAVMHEFVAAALGQDAADALKAEYERRGIWPSPTPQSEAPG